MKTADRVFQYRLEMPAMDYAIYLMIAPVLVYLLYEDWKDAVKNRSQHAEKD